MGSYSLHDQKLTAGLAVLYFEPSQIRPIKLVSYSTIYVIFAIFLSYVISNEWQFAPFSSAIRVSQISLLELKIFKSHINCPIPPPLPL